MPNNTIIARALPTACAARSASPSPSEREKREADVYKRQLFLSAKCKDTLTVLLISIVVLLMPLFAYVAMGATWPVSYTHLDVYKRQGTGLCTLSSEKSRDTG